MASLITYTKKMLVERIRRHMADNFPDASYSPTVKETLLYVDQALAFGLIGQAFNNAKIEGNLCVPEAYMTTYQLPALQQDPVTKYWYTTLPQPPVSLPLGYSIDEGYFANTSNGIGNQVFWIKQRRVAYRRNLPMPFGVRGWIKGSTVWLAVSDGSSLLNQNFYVSMASTRTEDLNDVMSLPDDAIEQIFQSVTMKIKDRLQLPKDIIQDDISAGNKSS
jgi:hypothetical protein